MEQVPALETNNNNNNNNSPAVVQQQKSALSPTTPKVGSTGQKQQKSKSKEVRSVSIFHFTWPLNQVNIIFINFGQIDFK